MSNKVLKYKKLYEFLEESIDFRSSEGVPLSTNSRSEIEVEGKQLGIEVEDIRPSNLDSLFRKGTNLYNRYIPGQYFNVGFDINDFTTQQEKTDYHTLAKILGIVVKSIFTWIKENEPDVVTIFADGSTEQESRKKLVIYASILQGNPELLSNPKYVWEKTKKASSGEPMLVLIKVKEK